MSSADEPARPMNSLTAAPGRMTTHVSPPSPLVDFARRVVVAVLLTLLLVLVAYVLWRGVAVLLQAFGGVLFGLFLSTLAEWLRKHSRLSYGWSLAVVVLGLFLLAGGFGWLLWSRLSSEIGELIPKLRQSTVQVREYLEQYPWGRFLIEEVPTTPASAAQMVGIEKAGNLVSGLASVLVTAAVILFVGGFGAAEPDQYKAGLFHLVPRRHRRRVGEAVDALAFNLRWWLLGQLLLMLLLWATTSLGLWLMGIPLALVLGLITGLFELIPYAGPWISAVPAALVALLVSPWHLTMVLGMYLGLHLMEGYLVGPLVQRKAVLLPPALTLVSQVLLWEMLGMLGLFVAAPLTVAVIVLLKMLYVEDTLGDQAVNVPGEPNGQTPTGATGHDGIRKQGPS
jgi:predicted PurR-regulated permease PerM